MTVEAGEGYANFMHKLMWWSAIGIGVLGTTAWLVLRRKRNPTDEEVAERVALLRSDGYGEDDSLALEQWLDENDDYDIDAVTLRALLAMDEAQLDITERETPTGHILIRANDHVFESADGETFDHYAEVYDFLDSVVQGDYRCEELLGDEEDRFNAEFWENPGPLYHGTSELEAVLEDGLETRSDSRGYSNRSVGAAVFATEEYEVARGYAYEPDPGVVMIDTDAMKRDGYTPFVSQEPDIVMYECVERLKHMLDDESYVVDIESGMDPATVIIHGEVPAKYLTVEE